MADRNTNLIVDVNGDVWASSCTCPLHEGAEWETKSHEAKPVGNVRDHEVVARLDLGPTTEGAAA